MVRALVLADTHLRSHRSRRLPAPVDRAIDRCDLIIHAGDMVDAAILAELHARRPVIAVQGNNDEPALKDALARQLTTEIGGVAVAMVHETGAAVGRRARLQKRFPQAKVVIFGHSHQPLDEWHDGLLLFNPGSPTERRRQAQHSYGWLELDRGEIKSHEIVYFNA